MTCEHADPQSTMQTQCQIGVTLILLDNFDVARGDWVGDPASSACPSAEIAVLRRELVPLRHFV